MASTSKWIGSAILRRMTFSTVGVLAVLACYFLSVGPAYRMHATGRLSQSAFLKVYNPLLTLRDSAPKPLAGAFDWYMRLWYDYRGRAPDAI